MQKSSCTFANASASVVRLDAFPLQLRPAKEQQQTILHAQNVCIERCQFGDRLFSQAASCGSSSFATGTALGAATLLLVSERRRHLVNHNPGALAPQT